MEGIGEIIIGSAVLSMLHALLPNHWLPILAVGQKQQWTLSETLTVTGIGAFAHSLSTIIIGFLMGYLGYELSERFSHIIPIIGPSLLIVMGIFFLYQHHAHNHFHISDTQLKKLNSKPKIILALAAAMMLSPCLEISGYFFNAGAHGLDKIAIVAILYAACTIVGMLTWVWWLYPHVKKMDWHALEHKAGLIAGWILILSGVVSFFLH